MWETVADNGRWAYQVKQHSPGGKWYARKVSSKKGNYREPRFPCGPGRAGAGNEQKGRRIMEPGHYVIVCGKDGVISTVPFNNLERALGWLYDLFKQSNNWGKCYTIRSDGRYVFEAEFQQRT